MGPAVRTANEFMPMIKERSSSSSPRMLGRRVRGLPSRTVRASSDQPRWALAICRSMGT